MVETNMRPVVCNHPSGPTKLYNLPEFPLLSLFYIFRRLVFTFHIHCIHFACLKLICESFRGTNMPYLVCEMEEEKKKNCRYTNQDKGPPEDAKLNKINHDENTYASKPPPPSAYLPGPTPSLPVSQILFFSGYSFTCPETPDPKWVPLTKLRNRVLSTSHLVAHRRVPRHWTLDPASIPEI